MKDKIAFLIIGTLIGVIITTAGFLNYNKILSNNLNEPKMMQMNGSEQMPQPQNGNIGEPLEKPEGGNGEEPAEKPKDTNNDVNS